MLTIHVTNRIVGKTVLYELKNQLGKKVPVNLYEMVVELNGRTTLFAVTRDSSQRIFGPAPKELYGYLDECPPNRPGEPYQAIPVTHWTKTFALRLGEQDSLHCDTIQGEGPIPRTYIMIHAGPGRSLGCLMIAGGTEGHQRFERHIEPYTKTADAVIRVYVQSRHPDGTP